MAFSVLVEVLNLRYKAVQNRRRARAAAEPVHLRPAYLSEGGTTGTDDPPGRADS